jgi:hypothetical protein
MQRHSSLPVPPLFLCLALLPCPYAPLVSCSTTVTMPNTSYPGLGEVYRLTLTYADIAAPHLIDLSYPHGYPTLSVALCGSDT